MGSEPTKPKKHIYEEWTTIDHLIDYNIVKHKETGKLG